MSAQSYARLSRFHRTPTLPVRRTVAPPADFMEDLGPTFARRPSFASRREFDEDVGMPDHKRFCKDVMTQFTGLGRKLSALQSRLTDIQARLDRVLTVVETPGPGPETEPVVLDRPASGASTVVIGTE